MNTFSSFVLTNQTASGSLSSKWVKIPSRFEITVGSSSERSVSLAQAREAEGPSSESQPRANKASRAMIKEAVSIAKTVRKMPSWMRGNAFQMTPRDPDREELKLLLY